jgi:hypothetical protein
MFDFSSNYASKYKIVKFDETTECGSNNYVPKTDVGYEYFELTYENFYGEFEYLAFHDCSSAFNCSSSEKSDYRIVEFDGQMLMEHAYKNDDGSCTYRSIDSKIRLNGDKVRLRYTFDEVTVQNYTDECSDSNVSNHYGEMECAKIRIIDGVME